MILFLFVFVCSYASDNKKGIDHLLIEPDKGKGYSINFGPGFMINEYQYFDLFINDLEIDKSLFKNNYAAILEIAYIDHYKQLIALNIDFSYSPNYSKLHSLGNTGFINEISKEIDTFNVNSRIQNEYYYFSLGFVGDLEIYNNIIFRWYLGKLDIYYFERNEIYLVNDVNNYKIYDGKNQTVADEKILDRSNKLRIDFSVGLALKYFYEFNTSNTLRGISFEIGASGNLFLENQRIWMYRFSSLIHFNIGSVSD